MLPVSDFPEQYVIFQVGMIPSKYFGILGEKNLTAFKSHTLIAVLIIVAMAFVSQFRWFFSSGEEFIISKWLADRHGPSNLKYKRTATDVIQAAAKIR